MNPAVSFVIPLFQSADTIADLVRDLEGFQIEGGHEIVLVNDGSSDKTSEICRELVARARADHAGRTRAQLRRAQRRAHGLAARARRLPRESG